MTVAPTSVETLAAKYGAMIDTTPVVREREPEDRGRDLFCLDEMKTGRYVTGITLIGQRLYRMVKTRPGTLRGSRTLRSWGLGIEYLIGGPAGPSARGRIEGKIRNGFRRDPMVEGVSVAATETRTASGLLTWQIGADVQSALGPFRLVLNVDEGLSASFLGLEPLRRTA